MHRDRQASLANDCAWSVRTQQLRKQPKAAPFFLKAAWRNDREENSGPVAIFAIAARCAGTGPGFRYQGRLPVVTPERSGSFGGKGESFAAPRRKLRGLPRPGRPQAGTRAQ
jgi:hypothetical protein